MFYFFFTYFLLATNTDYYRLLRQHTTKETSNMTAPRGTRDNDDGWTTGSDEENGPRDVYDVSWAYSTFIFWSIFFHLLFISCRLRLL
jgi:hypothetical protein